MPAGDNTFRKQRTAETRAREAAHHRQKHEGKIPVIVVPMDVGPTPFNKYSVDGEVTVAQFMAKLKSVQVHHVAPHEAVYLMVRTYRQGSADADFLPPTAATVGALDRDHRSDDGFVYMFLCRENVFG